MSSREYLKQHPDLKRIIRELKASGDVREIVSLADLDDRLSAEDVQTLLAYLREFGRVFEPEPTKQ